MVGKRRDLKQRTTRYRSSTPRDELTEVCNPLGGPCNVWGFLCPPSHSDPSCCSSLMFMLDSACQACTGSTKNQTWEDYIKHDAAPQSCDSSTPSAPPSYLPAMTAANVVPQWAITMASFTPTPTAFDFNAAVSMNAQLHKNPSQSISAPQTSSTSQVTQQTSITNSPSRIDSSTSVPSSPSANPTSSQSNPTSVQASPSPIGLASKTNSKVPVGAIAGGIIGGLVLLGLIGVGLFYLRRRRRGHPMAPSAAYKAALRAGNQSPSPYQIVHGHSDSVDNSTEDLTQGFQRPASWISSRPISIHSESRFHEHTTSS